MARKTKLTKPIRTTVRTPEAGETLALETSETKQPHSTAKSVTSRRLGAIALMLLGLAAAVWFLTQILKIGNPSASTTVDSDPKSLLRAISSVSEDLSEQIGNAVVRIDVEGDLGVVATDDELSQLFGPTELPAREGQGSGMVVAADGYVLTNYHVIRNASKIIVSIGSDKYDAKEVGVDILTDLALLKLDANALETIQWGDSDAVRVGQFVWAVGSPFGLEGSVTFGIVSAKERSGLNGEDHLLGLMQTDAAVNPGNSGGPLVDLDGKVIGVNTSIVGQTNLGISFAIPSNTAKTVVERLRSGGRVERGWLGITLENVPADILSSEKIRGAFVVRVIGSPARTGGLKVNDVITAWGGSEVVGPIALNRLIAETAIGTKVEVTVQRQGVEKVLSITVGKRP